MGGLSITHILILTVVLIIFFAPKRVGQAGKSVGEAIRGFKRGLNGDEIDVTPRREILDASDLDAAQTAEKEKARNRQDS